MSRNLVDDNRPKAVIYCRVAANNELNTKVNEIVVANQEAICREYADNKGYQIASIFIDFDTITQYCWSGPLRAVPLTPVTATLYIADEKFICKSRFGHIIQRFVRRFFPLLYFGFITSGNSTVNRIIYPHML